VELEQKFLNQAKMVFSEERAKAIVNPVSDLESMSDVSNIIKKSMRGTQSRKPEFQEHRTPFE